MAEEDRMLAGDRSGRQRAGEEHGELPADGEQGVKSHDPEDGGSAVMPDPARELAGQRREDEAVDGGHRHTTVWRRRGLSVSAMRRSCPREPELGLSEGVRGVLGGGYRDPDIGAVRVASDVRLAAVPARDGAD